MNPVNLIIMILLISLLVLVHEWGHYIAARIFGVRVSKFGFGMPIGPVLFKTKKGDLEILVHACLLGGYVSFPEDEEDEENAIKLPEDSKERFKNQAPWKQAVIVTAGVIMNTVFAFFLIVLAASIFHKLPTGKNEVFISEVLNDGMVAKEMPGKFKAGDKILKVNGLEADSVYKFIFMVQNSKLNDNKAAKETIDSNLDEFLKLNPEIKKNEIIPVGTKVTLPLKKPENQLLVKDEVARGFEKY
ncbi:MAG: site-2 protease family protein [bacterium]|nr:site-2 protease family protein [bacterium]